MTLWLRSKLPAPPSYLSPLLHVMIVLSVSNLITYHFTYIVLTLSLPRLGPPTHHRPTSTRPWDLKRATCLLTPGYDSGCSPCVKCVCVCECVPPSTLFLSVPGMWRFVWRVSHTLCYQHLCDEHKHSLRGLGVVSQMVQCQGPRVWFRRWWVALIPRLSEVLPPRAAKVPSSLARGKKAELRLTA